MKNKLLMALVLILMASSMSHAVLAAVCGFEDIKDATTGRRISHTEDCDDYTYKQEYDTNGKPTTATYANKHTGKVFSGSWGSGISAQFFKDLQEQSLHNKYLRFAAAGTTIAQYIKLIQPSPGAFAIESTIERFVEGKKDVSSYDANPETFGTLAFLWDNFPLSHTEELWCKSKASSYFIRDVAGSLSTRGTLPSRGSILFATGRRTECNLPSGCDGNKFRLPNGSSYLYKLSWYVANPSSKSDYGNKAGVREDGSIVFSVRLYEGNQQTGTLGQFKIGPGGFSSQTEVKYSSRFYSKVCIVFDEGYVYDDKHTEWPANCPNLVEEKPKTPGFIQQQVTTAPPGNAPPSAPPTGGETLQDPNW